MKKIEIERVEAETQGGENKEESKIYLAGYIDGSGKILVQIVKNLSHKFKFQIKVGIVFNEKSTRH